MFLTLVLTISNGALPGPGECPASNTTIELAVRRVEFLARAAQAARRGSIISIERPLLSFFIPKTGSNTQQHFMKAALAVDSQQFHSGCNVHATGGQIGCMTDNANLNQTACSMAFGASFRPEELVRTLATVNQNPAIDPACWRRYFPGVAKAVPV